VLCEIGHYRLCPLKNAKLAVYQSAEAEILDTDAIASIGRALDNLKLHEPVKHAMNGTRRQTEFVGDFLNLDDPAPLGENP
jgi:hypothetical protein